LLASVLIGIGFSLFIAFPGYIIGDQDAQTRSSPFLSVFFAIGLALNHESSHAAILEEPIFRGFLWGYLANRGWRDKSIWIIQGALFWLAHLSYWDRPYTFFVTVPAGSLLLGWLAWRSRSVGACMVAHGLFNALRFVSYYLLSLL
jgi:membrane protease YdiL (CAAX protease family)